MARIPPEQNMGLKMKSSHGVLFSYFLQRTSYEPIALSSFFSGFVNKDVAFFHTASKTLIQADLLFNLPCTEQYSNTKSSGSVPLISSYLNPHTYLHRQFLWMTGKDKACVQKYALLANFVTDSRFLLKLARWLGMHRQ